MIEVQCIAGAGDILIKPPVGFADDSRRRCRCRGTTSRAEMVALAAVVVDDIEDDLDPGVVQPLYRGLNPAIDGVGRNAGSGAK